MSLAIEVFVGVDANQLFCWTYVRLTNGKQHLGTKSFVHSAQGSYTLLLNIEPEVVVARAAVSMRVTNVTVTWKLSVRVRREIAAASLKRSFLAHLTGEQNVVVVPRIRTAVRGSRLQSA